MSISNPTKGELRIMLASALEERDRARELFNALRRDTGVEARTGEELVASIVNELTAFRRASPSVQPETAPTWENFGDEELWWTLDQAVMDATTDKRPARFISTLEWLRDRFAPGAPGASVAGDPARIPTDAETVIRSALRLSHLAPDTKSMSWYVGSRKFTNVDDAINALLKERGVAAPADAPTVTDERMEGVLWRAAIALAGQGEHDLAAECRGAFDALVSIRTRSGQRAPNQTTESK